MKQKIIKFIKEFLQIDELENQLTQIDNELQDNVSELDGMRMDVEDRPTLYDMESYTCLLYTSPRPRDKSQTRLPSTA